MSRYLGILAAAAFVGAADTLSCNLETLDQWRRGDRSPQQAVSLWEMAAAAGGRLILVRLETVDKARVAWEAATLPIALQVVFYVVSTRYKARIEFSREVGILPNLVGAWQHGKRKPSLASMFLMLDHLGLDLVYIPPAAAACRGG